MKIISSTLGMDATTVYRDVNMTEGRLDAQGGSTTQSDFFRLDLKSPQEAFLRVSTSKENSEVQAVTHVTGGAQTVDHDWSKQSVVSKMVSEIVGRQVQIRELNSGGQPFADVTAITSEDDAGKKKAVSSSNLQVTVGLQQVQYQYDKLKISTSGTVETADGRTIGLQLELILEREEYTEQRAYANIISSRFVDPLVLSFGDGLSVIGDSKFCFDLDCDGKAEEINRLRSGSGFLVLDKNGDGSINDGREMFGPSTGYGYDELRIYDTDGNNWIDENDAIFDQLQLWMGGGESGRLLSLRQAGVGALSLASADVHFNLKDRGGRIIGQVRESGLFITEDGAVRPLVEIDMAIQDENRMGQWQNYSLQLREAMASLRAMIADRRERSARAMALHLRQDKAERQQDWLLKRLLEIQEDRINFTG